MSTKTTPALVGIYEVAAILNLKRSTARAWATRGKLPEPVARLECGTIWLKADIEAMVKS